MKKLFYIACVLLAFCFIGICLQACATIKTQSDSQAVADKALGYFYDILKIPRGSDNEQEISNYLVAFAKKNSLQAVQDFNRNVLITKAASKGRENEPPVILQVHMDMVCEKNDGVIHDFLKDPIIPIVEGDWIFADGTTLGADNACGMAMVMAVLSTKNLSHPPLEVIITANEEGGRGPGANAFNVSQLKGKRFINVDAEWEDAITVSCGGIAGSEAIISEDYQTIPKDLATYTLMVKGLTGGHSAIDIHMGRANAIIVMARVLERLETNAAVYLTRINGGSANNAIPRECTAEISFNEKELVKLQSLITQMEGKLKLDYRSESIIISLEKTEAAKNVLTQNALRKVINCILSTPNGVIARDPNSVDIIQTSSNLGIISTVSTTRAKISINKMLRSSVTEDMNSLIKEMDIKAKEAGAFSSKGELWGRPWEKKENSPLRETMAVIYKDVYGREPIIGGVHGRVECAVFAGKIPGCDMVAIGPTIEGSHSPNERMSLSSFNRTCIYLIKVLEKI